MYHLNMAYTVPNASVTLEEALAHKPGGHVLMLSMSHFKFFIPLETASMVIYLPPELCLCEMVLDDTARPCIDFDGDVENSIDAISACVEEYIHSNTGHTCTVRWKWSEPELGEQRRWHCIVSGVYYDNCWKGQCSRLALHVASKCSVNCVDMAIYRNNASLRAVGQYKLSVDGYCRRLYPYTKCNVSNVCISPHADDAVVRGDAVVPMRIQHQWSHVQQVQVLPGLVVHSVTDTDAGSLWRLRRIFPWYCPICDRVHMHNNAYMTIRHGVARLGCYMSPGNYATMW